MVYTNITKYEFMSNAIPQQKFVMRFRPNHDNPIIDVNQFNNSSDMFIAIHNQQYNLFKVGVPATPGIVSLVETGMPDDLVDELLEQPDSYINYYVGAPNQNEYRMEATGDFRYMSFMTMINPSALIDASSVDGASDWFMGVDSIEIMDVEQARIFPVFAYDAGIANSNILFQSPTTLSGRVSDSDQQLLKPVSYVNTKESNTGVMFTISKRPPIQPVAYIEIVRVPDLDVDTINNRDVVI